MKYLIDANFVAIRRGSFVNADEKAGEFIFDPENKVLKKAQLEEIARANKLKFAQKLGTPENYEIIETGLNNMTTIPEQNAPTESDKVKAIVSAGHASGKSEDQILIEIVKADISYKKAGKLYREAVEFLGLAVNTKDLKTAAGEIMAKAEFAPKAFEELEKMVKTIAEKFPKAELGQINSVIRRYLRANKVEIPEAPKGQRGATGFRKVAFDWMLANANSTDEQFKDFIVKEKGKDEKIADRFVEFFKFAKEFAAVGNKQVAAVNATASVGQAKVQPAEKVAKVG